jgi:heterotetrameric sarcosine oxidase delta subunit
MLALDCPNCGRRNGLEFAYSGEAGLDEPSSGGDIAEWRRSLYFHRNGAEWTRERWLHVAGCGRFIELERHRTTNEIRATIGPPPERRTGPT